MDSALYSLIALALGAELVWAYFLRVREEEFRKLRVDHAREVEKFDEYLEEAINDLNERSRAQQEYESELVAWANELSDKEEDIEAAFTKIRFIQERQERAVQLDEARTRVQPLPEVRNQLDSLSETELLEMLEKRHADVQERLNPQDEPEYVGPLVEAELPEERPARPRQTLREYLMENPVGSPDPDNTPPGERPQGAVRRRGM